MLPIHRILHPTDFSKRSEYALHLACALARDYGAELILLHVVEIPAAVYGEGVMVPLPDFRAEAEARLAELRPTLPTVRTEHRLVEGDPASEILQAALDVHSDLIVMGTHGRTGVSRLLMGSVAEQVVRRATCPVLTIKAPFPITESVREAAAVQAEEQPVPVAQLA
jgi:nucleotide-binding universal stress UspA family protein